MVPFAIIVYGILMIMVMRDFHQRN